MNKETASRWITIGIGLLPIYGALTAWATWEGQPDQVSDPEGWARFVTSASYLAAHLIGSIGGTVLAIFGTFALGLCLAYGRMPRLGLTGMTLAVLAQALFLVPGAISTFATPAIGTAYLAGNTEIMTTLAFPTVLSLVLVVALLAAVVGNVLLGVAVWRSGLLPRWTGLVWAAGALVFYVLGAVLGMLTTGASLPTQPLGALLLVISGVGMTLAARRPVQERALDHA